jgi:Zn-dependent protease
MSQDFIFNIITKLIPLIIAIGIHEYAHVAAARWLGDRTGEAMGRLTLNPLVHADPLWTIGLPLIWLFQFGGMPPLGAGKPAPFNPLAFTRTRKGKRISMTAGTAFVAAAGPISNVLLAIVSAIVLAVLVKSGVNTDMSGGMTNILLNFIVMNFGLAVFNMIPVPPLDGSKVIVTVLPYAWRQKYEEISGAASIVLLIGVFMFAGVIVSPVVRILTSALLSVIF